jgi:uncharacterized protein (TIGR00297 family)
MLDYLIYIFLLAGVVLSIISGKLTTVGAITGGIIGVLIFKGVGYTGVAMLTLFFILGSVATGWKSKKKQQLGMAEPDKGRRTAGQVIANGGVAALLGGLVWVFPEQATLLQLMMAGSFAAATADTLASELGSLYGSSFYDVITFKKVQRGPDGVVSLAGTLIGAAGAGLIAVIYALGFGFSGFVWVIVTAGAIGNLFDSVLGATFERRHQLGNNMVNFFNTATGAGVCLLLHWFFK